MSTIRNISGAPSFGSSSALTTGNGSRRRPRSQNEVEISTSPFSHLGNFGSIAEGRGSISSRRLSISHPEPASPSAPSGRFRKLRSSTWDSASKISPKILTKSHSLDHGSPASSLKSTRSHSATLQSSQGWDLIGETSRDSAIDPYSFDSDSLSDGTKECEAEKVDETEPQAPLSPVREMSKEGNNFSPGSSFDGDTLGGTSDKTSRNIDPIKTSEPGAKNVTFSTEVTEYDDKSKRERETRPSFCAKLPALTHWDPTDVEGEHYVDRDPSFPANVVRNGFRRQNTPPNPGFLAKINPFGDLSWSIIGSCIVRWAPCFLCSKRPGVSMTDREILLRLNVVFVFFCVGQIIAGLFLFILHFTGYEDREGGTLKPLVSFNLWSMELFVYILALVNFILLIASIRAQQAIRDVNLVGALRFMWVLFWLFPIQIFCMIGSFDWFDVQEVIVKHWWDAPEASRIRKVFCPSGTADNKCKVPVSGGIDYANEQEWCEANWNATDCQKIRDNTQGKYNIAAKTFYYVNGFWALATVIIMWVILCVLQAIITLPIVQRSKELNIPFWLTPPMVGSYIIGFYLFDSLSFVQEEMKDALMIAVGHLVSGGAFTLAALIGYFLKCYKVLNGRQRRIKQGVVIFFMLTIMVAVFSVGTIFVTSLIYSLNIMGLPLKSHDYGEIACGLDKSLDGSCTGCDTGCDNSDCERMCPELDDSDVRSVLQTIFKMDATVAATSLVYALITLRYGFVLFRHVSRYQIEYV